MRSSSYQLCCYTAGSTRGLGSNIRLCLRENKIWGGIVHEVKQEHEKADQASDKPVTLVFLIKMFKLQKL